MKIVTAAEMREIDRVTSERFGVPSLTLMENAGTAVARLVVTEYPEARRIAVICGKGNNGGDGFVAARKLHELGKDVRLVLLSEPSDLRGDAAEMFTRVPVKPIVVRSAEELREAPAGPALEADLLVDAILGTGVRPPVTGLYAAAIAVVNANPASVVAVDVPSGADADTPGEQVGPMVRADAIATFTAPRPAHVLGRLIDPFPRRARRAGAKATAATIIAPIGSPLEAIVSSSQLNLTTPADIAPLIGPRPADGNKGLYGHVLVVGGSLGKAGAAAMAGMAALRVGAGLSTVATARSALGTVAGFHPELMTEALPETESGCISSRAQTTVSALVGGKTVLAIGPGISRHPESAELVRELVRNCSLPIILDADGLNAFEGRAAELPGQGRTLVLTPHPGEMARLVGSTVAEVQKDRLGVARKFAREHNVLLVLKGHRTLVAHPDGEVWVNPTGNPGMATGGTGDVLTGMLAGLLAQNQPRVLSSIFAAVYLHGLAGDIACESTGEHSLVATDLIRALPEAFRRLREAAGAACVQV
jgi:ADP-dependent NAD(P)H-hydrate dehydratase / NAD(P)H-hydrate epimerase